MSEKLIIDQYLTEMTKHNASDMYLTVGFPPSIRGQDQVIRPIYKNPMKQSDVDVILNELLSDEKKEEFETTLELNLSVKRADKSRYRFNVFRQQDQTGIVIRRINTIIPSMKDLGLPDLYSKVIMKKRGLIILASPGGSGKSTSMAAMLEFRNLNGNGHILTIEDPIEYVHEHKQCIVTQREVGSDTFSFGMALRNALRQRADVIAIGEIRDRESMEHAMRFAETGHLCVATLHSNNSAQAIDRIVNLFPEDSRRHVLSTLSQNLLSVFSQRLVKGIEGKSILAFDILLCEGLIKNLIATDKMPDLRDAIERGYDLGMRTFDQSLFDLFARGKISMDVAITEADNPSALKLRIHQGNLAPVEMIRSKEDRENQF